MSKSYEKYSKMTSEELQKKIDEDKVSVAYLKWLGVIGQGKAIRDLIIKREKK